MSHYSAIFANLLNGPLGTRVLRNRGRSRAIVSAQIVKNLRCHLNDFLDGKWLPSKSTASSGYVVSLTSWRPRLPDLPLVLFTLLRQTLRPSLIHVWLAPSDYALMDSIATERFSAHGVHFESCDDLGPHKKWLPMIERGAREPFVICDDDILYPSKWFENLMRQDRDDAYVGTRCHRIQRDTSGIPLSYSEWSHDVAWELSPSNDLFITGCGGAIIHPDRISGEFRDREALFDKCPRADDIWLKVAHAAAGIPCYKTRYSFPCLEIPGSGATSLMQTNVDNGGNDSQLRAVMHWLH
jgi:hypothetical protein